MTPWVHAIARYKFIDLWGRKAGSLPSFERYSEALRSSGIVWDERSLDGWLTDDRMVPVKNPQDRAVLASSTIFRVTWIKKSLISE